MANGTADSQIGYEVVKYLHENNLKLVMLIGEQRMEVFIENYPQGKQR
jgi:hypothetical protein